MFAFKINIVLTFDLFGQVFFFSQEVFIVMKSGLLLKLKKASAAKAWLVKMMGFDVQTLTKGMLYLIIKRSSLAITSIGLLLRTTRNASSLLRSWRQSVAQMPPTALLQRRGGSEEEAEKAAIAAEMMLVVESLLLTVHYSLFSYGTLFFCGEGHATEKWSENELQFTEQWIKHHTTSSRFTWETLDKSLERP